jgi:hypothetical protein
MRLSTVPPFRMHDAAAWDCPPEKLEKLLQLLGAEDVAQIVAHAQVQVGRVAEPPGRRLAGRPKQVSGW